MVLTGTNFLNEAIIPYNTVDLKVLMEYTLQPHNLKSEGTICLLADGNILIHQIVTALLQMYWFATNPNKIY